MIGSQPTFHSLQVRLSKPLPFSIVVAVKGELELLRSSIPSYYRMQPNEVVFCLDDPVDNSELNVVKNLSLRFGGSKETKVVTVPRNPAYASYIAWKRRLGFRAASNERILSVDPDLILNRNVHKALARVGTNNIGYASCTTIYPVKGPVQLCQAMVHCIVSAVRPPPLTGLYALWRPYWLDTEDDGIKLLPDPLETKARGSMVAIGEDTYLLNCMRRKHKAIHLRSTSAYSMKPYHNLAKHAQYELGRYYAASDYPSWNIFLKSAALLQPHLIAGYVRQRENGSDVPTFNPRTYPY